MRLPQTKQGRGENELREAALAEAEVRDFGRQVAEVQIRAAVMNRFTALGIPVTVARG